MEEIIMQNKCQTCKFLEVKETDDTYSRKCTITVFPIKECLNDNFSKYVKKL